MFWEETTDTFLLPDPEDVFVVDQDDLETAECASSCSLAPELDENDNNETEAKEKKAKRRAAVAAASRATRAKKKRQLEDLRDQHIKLKQEREEFLSKIAELQMNVQSLRNAGSTDLRMENDLLRAELKEHKAFIAQLKRVADGLPTTNISKRVLMLRGANSAVSQVLGLLSTSMVDPSWTAGNILKYPQIKMKYQRLPHGSTSKTARRVTFRLDIPFAPIPAEGIAEVIWNTWEKADLAERLNKHLHKNISVAIKEIDIGLGTDFHTETRVFHKVDANENGSNNSRIQACYYRETRPAYSKTKNVKSSPDPRVDAVVDTVLVLTGRQDDFSLSSFPTTTTSCNVSEDAPVEESAVTEATVNSKEGSGTCPGIVLASTSTQHGSDLKPLQKGVVRVQSAVLEGYVFRKLDGGCAFTYVTSLPINSGTGKFLSVSEADGVINDQGFFTSAWEQVITEMISIIADSVPGFGI
uniref:BZIP domain-containing protein n=1 Tax=Aplanochytrium stocchinoi TaxID=215587 RepID=A0A7S3PPU3_9STRA